MTVPKLPAPITPTGFSDELLKVVAHEAVVVVVEDVKILCYDITLFIPEQRTFQMEDSCIVKTTFALLTVEVALMINLLLLIR